MTKNNPNVAIIKNSPEIGRTVVSGLARKRGTVVAIKDSMNGQLLSGKVVTVRWEAGGETDVPFGMVTQLKRGF